MFFSSCVSQHCRSRGPTSYQLWIMHLNTIDRILSRGDNKLQSALINQLSSIGFSSLPSCCSSLLFLTRWMEQRCEQTESQLRSEFGPAKRQMKKAICLPRCSLRTADAIPVVTSLPPEILRLRTREAKRFPWRKVFLADQGLARKIKELTRETSRKIVRVGMFTSRNWKDDVACVL